jgi:hypothetical protein
MEIPGFVNLFFRACSFLFVSAASKDKHPSIYDAKFCWESILSGVPEYRPGGS